MTTNITRPATAIVIHDTKLSWLDTQLIEQSALLKRIHDNGNYVPYSGYDTGPAHLAHILADKELKRVVYRVPVHTGSREPIMGKDIDVLVRERTSVAQATLKNHILKAVDLAGIRDSEADQWAFFSQTFSTENDGIPCLCWQGFLRRIGDRRGCLR